MVQAASTDEDGEENAGPATVRDADGPLEATASSATHSVTVTHTPTSSTISPRQRTHAHSTLTTLSRHLHRTLTPQPAPRLPFLSTPAILTLMTDIPLALAELKVKEELAIPSISRGWGSRGQDSARERGEWQEWY